MLDFNETKYLQELISNRTSVIIFLMNGFQMEGYITGLDQEAILIKSNGAEQMIYKHVISTVKPNK